MTSSTQSVVVGSVESDVHIQLPKNDADIDTVDSDSDMESLFSNASVDDGANTDATSVSGASDASSTFSITSSQRYAGAEPFGAFQIRVLVLARNIIWPGADIEHIIIERIPCNGDPRTIAITHQGTQEKRILRVPWPKHNEFRYTLGAYHLVKQHTEISIPDVLMSDTTSHSPLAMPYFVHTPPRGMSWFDSFRQVLDHQGKCKAAHHLGRMYREMLSIQSRVSGKLVLGVNPGEIHIALYSAKSRQEGWCDCCPNVELPEDPTPCIAAGLYSAYAPYSEAHDGPRESISELLLSTCQKLIDAYRLMEEKKGGNDKNEESEDSGDDSDDEDDDEYFGTTEWRIVYIERLMALISELSAYGYLDDVPICLHNDGLTMDNMLLDHEAQLPPPPGLHLPPLPLHASIL